MIKILLKHFIFDKCIDVAFEKITNNFIKPDIQSYKVKLTKIQDYRKKSSKAKRRAKLKGARKMGERNEQ